MMKRILSLVMAVLLCLCAMPGAVAEESLEALYRIVLRTEAGDRPLGSGVVFGAADTLLTAEACLREGELVAIGADGEHAVTSWEPVRTTGAALLHLAEPAAAAPIPLTSNASSIRHALYGVTAQGEFVSAGYAIPQRRIYRATENVLLSSVDGLLPGAVLLDDQGALVALTVSQQGEGEGLYTALYAANIGRGLNAADAFIPVELNWENGELRVTWTDTARGSGVYCLCYLAEENEYYTRILLAHDKREVVLALAPGHCYYFQLQWLASEDQPVAFDWDCMQTYTLPEGRFSQYGFQQRCNLVIARKGQRITQQLSSPALFTVDTLTDADTSRYLQMVYTHQVTEEVTLPMTISLIAPDGQCFFLEKSCTFSPTEAGEECFAALPVDTLLAECGEYAGGGLSAGEYTLCWSLAGRLAGTYAFTVEPAGTPVPEEAAPSGVLEDLRATAENGFIDMDWSACTVPEGKTVTAYIAYENNLYFSYIIAEADETQVSFVGIPGGRCYVWAVYGDAEQTFLLPQGDAQRVALECPAPQPITLNGLRNLRCSVVVSTDATAQERAEYLPEIPVTREALARGERLYFQTEDTYTVSETSTDHALAVVLTTPDGTRLLYGGGYTFSPELCASDLWVVDITEMADGYTEQLEGAAWPAGTYTVGYYIDGQTVAECAFALE